MANAERALERLYEDPDLRDELRDTEAQSLLKWAEAQVVRLAEESADDAEFDTKFETLRGMLKDMNRFVGKRSELDSDTQAAKLGDISAAAQALGAPATLSAQSAADWKSLDDSAALNTLIDSVALPAKPAADKASAASAQAGDAKSSVASAQSADASVGEGIAPPAKHDFLTDSAEPADSSAQLAPPAPLSAPPLSAAAHSSEIGAGKSPVGSDTTETQETVKAIIPAEDAPKDLSQTDHHKTPLYPMPPKETEPNDEAQDTDE